MMLVIAAFKGIRIFVTTAKILIKKLRTARRLVISLVMITFIGSIFIANDMALLTFLPLTLYVFKECGKKKYVAFTITMQTVAANLGGMIMPFGNPQSLYLYSYFTIPLGEFVATMIVPFLVSTALIIGLCFIVKPEPVSMENNEIAPIDKKRAVLYSILAALAILAVFRVVNYIVATGIIAAVLLVADYKSYKLVDYGLLMTFVAFFIFANNMSRLPSVQSFVGGLLEKNVLLTAVVSCQFISNVPTSIFLSKFSNNYRALLLATNIGGCGTPIASLASLISLKAYNSGNKGYTLKYLGLFSLINFSFLLILTCISLFLA
jgi:Na+/H+ antiporter NhaD/arsenite permease-like protein